MTQRIHRTGKEYETKVLFDDLSVAISVEVGLFNNASDNVSVSDTNPDTDITTEPDDALDYSRQTVDIPADVTVSQEGDRWRASFDTLTFNVDDNTETVDSYFVVVNFDATDYLYMSADLDQSYDLGMIGELNLAGTGIERATGSE